MWLKWAASCSTIIVLGWAAPAVLGPNILSKGVETGPTATQFGLACAQTMSRLPGARLRQTERGAYPLFLLQNELFSSFYRGLNFSPISAARLSFFQFLLQKELFSIFCHRTDFSPVSAAEGTFLQFLPQD